MNQVWITVASFVPWNGLELYMRLLGLGMLIFLIAFIIIGMQTELRRR